jgi:DNA-3-methyladenine glycosylase I
MNRAASRCTWASGDPLMPAYHDEEWGVPHRDSRALWEMWMLEGFQAGLSWAIVLRKREAFRKAFAGLDPDLVAGFTPRDLDRLLTNPGIIRARAKIEATITGARIFREMRDRGEDFAAGLEGFETTSVQVRGPHDRLCLDAGRGHRQRPLAALLSSRAGGA